MIKLLLATNNSGKIKELRSLLTGLDLDILTPDEIGLDLRVKETGNSYQENAIIKAVAFTEAAKMWSLADDSGLEVEVLNGAPGLYSSRYAVQPDATDGDRREVLLRNLAGKPQPWKAAFYCMVALCSPEGKIFTREGICPGEIIPEERGDGGFGYDPVFLLAGSDSTMAELTSETKNELSHRGQAVRLIKPLLEELITKGDMQDHSS
jgi:XTP/dITP diphosphohydrolase